MSVWYAGFPKLGSKVDNCRDKKVIMEKKQIRNGNALSDVRHIQKENLN